MVSKIKRIRSLAMKSFEAEMGIVGGVGESIHGINHWEDVYLNGEILSNQKGVDPLVVKLFAYLHDCKRQDDGQDFYHGERAAAYVNELSDNGELDFLTVEQLRLLHYACSNHNKADISHDPTIGACYDADRLELIRCGIIPDPKLMNTPLGVTIASKMQKTKEVCEQYL